MGFRLVLALRHVDILDRPTMKTAPAGNAAMREPGAALDIQTVTA